MPFCHFLPFLGESVCGIKMPTVPKPNILNSKGANQACSTYLQWVPNQEFAPLEVKNEKTGTVGKSRSLSGQVLSISKFMKLSIGEI